MAGLLVSRTPPCRLDTAGSSSLKLEVGVSVHIVPLVLAVYEREMLRSLYVCPVPCVAPDSPFPTVPAEMGFHVPWLSLGTLAVYGPVTTPKHPPLGCS